jgi:hypothetical protein
LLAGIALFHLGRSHCDQRILYCSDMDCYF